MSATPDGSSDLDECYLPSLVLLQEFGYTHLSAGDLLRAERADKSSKYGVLIDTHIKEGKIVPVKITCGLLERVSTYVRR